MTSMDANAWNERYAASELVWSAEPNRFVAEIVGPLEPGSAADIAAGEGRNAIWLVEQGWTVLATDYSDVAISRLRDRAAAVLGDRADRLTAVVADATLAVPGEGGHDLVLFSYLQLPPEQMRAALRAGLAAVRPGGRLVVVGHAGRNLEHGWGGPSERTVLYDPDEVLAHLDAAGAGAVVEVAEIRVRPVDTYDGPREALDTVVILRR
ncbi:methyltransferase family protein [Humibacillus xanthopallidus]|uniref:Methyltransferase family protein n=2 Tax=Humibacillus xanthopallidus TaxID=412689 RepID=A0A543PNZ5_9MICO|nr:methyltransferase family protein [Humibacillus xanthopallidus]